MEMAKKKQKNNKGKKQVGTAVKMDSRFPAWKAQLTAQIDGEDYAEAITTLATMIQAKACDAECMYQGAYAYFMMGDYIRATQWVENTLQYDGQNVPARLLLARICILEDRSEDGLAVFEFVLKQFASQLTDDQREDVRDILDYYGTSEPERIEKEYPAIAAFLGLKGQEEEVADDAISPKILAETPEESCDSKAEAELQQIREQKISIAAKIKLLNTFAGGYFYQQDWNAAKLFLTEACQLDEHDDQTLRNLAVLYANFGEKEKAMQFVMAMSYVDFSLLQVIR